MLEVTGNVFKVEDLIAHDAFRVPTNSNLGNAIKTVRELLVAKSSEALIGDLPGIQGLKDKQFELCNNGQTQESSNVFLVTYQGRMLVYKDVISGKTTLGIAIGEEKVEQASGETASRKRPREEDGQGSPSAPTAKKPKPADRGCTIV